MIGWWGPQFSASRQQLMEKLPSAGEMWGGLPNLVQPQTFMHLTQQLHGVHESKCDLTSRITNDEATEYIQLMVQNNSNHLDMASKSCW